MNINNQQVIEGVVIVTETVDRIVVVINVTDK